MSAPVDQKALVEVIRSAIGKWESSRVGWAAEHSIADALLAAGLRLPGSVQPAETLAWAVEGVDGRLSLRVMAGSRADAERAAWVGDRVVRVAVRRIVEDEA